ncbi:MAG TPA: hypothetical protein VG388_07120 [Solirubrobacteraceae bacterium]|jgi:hypothetical protein|nr:hypothetical protein [Solirubrobacteraceae bacterium]
MSEDGNLKPDPVEQVSRLYEEVEAQAAKASEQLVGSSGFATLLARAAENAAALTKLSADAMDFVLRNLRVAGRRDVVSLARQLARTEDKLERVLQEVEKLRDEAAGSRRDGGRGKGTTPREETATPRPRTDRSPRAPAGRRKGST